LFVRAGCQNTRRDESTASAAAPVTRPGANPVLFRLRLLAYHCVHGTAPMYLTESLRLTSEVAVVRRCPVSNAIDQTVNARRVRVACGCNAGVQHLTAADQDRFLTHRFLSFVSNALSFLQTNSSVSFIFK